MINQIAKLCASATSKDFKAAFICFFLVLGSGIRLDSALAQSGNMEIDARTVPWSSVTRLALEAGIFPPTYRPITEKEISRILAVAWEEAKTGESTALADENEYARLAFLIQRYQQDSGRLSFNGHSDQAKPHLLRISGHISGGYSELGSPIPHEGGLSFAPGNNIFLEPAAEFSTGSFWSALNFRIGGQISDGGIGFDWSDGNADPLTWPDWPIPTGRSEVRDARLKSNEWTSQITRALIGLKLGNWSLSAGWDQRRTGPGLTGNLNLDYQGRPFPAITARRTSCFQWNGLMTHVSPDFFLVRAGKLSEQEVSWNDIYGHSSKEASPYFFQWLLGWNITSWFRTNFTHTVMATAREGTLWPDLMQINFPIIGTTWREMDSGPITDRLFAVQFEFRWRNAPWPLLPSSAGRLFWDYGGTDFLPSGPGGMVPQISIPASIAGFELLSPRWDLGFEYAELQHTSVLWYSNGGYAEGYSNDQWLIGHPLGGSGESLTGLIRLRPAGWGLQAELQGKKSTWGMLHRTPGTGELHTLGLTLSRTHQVWVESDTPPSSPLLWEVTAEWNREKADPLGFISNPPSNSMVERDWWRIIFKVGI